MEKGRCASFETGSHPLGSLDPGFFISLSWSGTISSFLIATGASFTLVAEPGCSSFGSWTFWLQELKIQVDLCDSFDEI